MKTQGYGQYQTISIFTTAGCQKGLKPSKLPTHCSILRTFLQQYTGAVHMWEQKYITRNYTAV